MKPFHSHRQRNRHQGGFNLAEAMFSVGVMSFGFLALIPLLAIGSKDARSARDNRATTQIAETLIEEATQGISLPTTSYLDAQGNPCAPASALYTVQADYGTVAGDTKTVVTTSSTTRLTLRVTPLGEPGHPRIYAVVLPAP